MLLPRIYLDNNATTAVDPQVLEAIVNELKLGPANPSSTHHFGQEAKGRLIRARKKVAAYFNVPSSEVIFTSGGTEGLNMLLKGHLSQMKGGHVITSDLEHPAVYNTLLEMQKQGCEVSFLSGGLHGAITASAVRNAIRPQTCLIALMAVNNETGVKTDLAEIGAVAEENKIPFVVDGVAWVGKERVAIPAGVSALCFSGHKFHGPKGSGGVIVRSSFQFSPLLIGGPQEYQKRGGTENLSAIVGLSEAFSLLETRLPFATEEMQKLRERLEQGLLSSLEGCFVNGTGERICNTTNLGFEGIDGESLLIALDQQGIAVSHGSACSSGALEPSRVLLNMGISKNFCNGSLRFSLSRYTTKQEIDRCLEVVTAIVKAMRR